MRVFVTGGNLVDFATSNPALVCRGGSSIAYVDDVAAAIVCALKKGRRGERYILGGEHVDWSGWQRSRSTSSASSAGSYRLQTGSSWR